MDVATSCVIPQQTHEMRWQVRRRQTAHEANGMHRTQRLLQSKVLPNTCIANAERCDKQETKCCQLATQGNATSPPSYARTPICCSFQQTARNPTCDPKPIANKQMPMKNNMTEQRAEHLHATQNNTTTSRRSCNYDRHAAMHR